MKAIGIVAEYNPFHNGHLYQINKIKEKYPDYAIVAVMSGNFVQRGDVSIIDKFKRCEIALNNGIDLVVELPFVFSTQSADMFSYGAITILEKLGVERVIFGSEDDDIDTLELIAKTQIENDEFEKLVKIYSKFGKNYPTAISCALEDLTGKKITCPNDLLGVSYIKTILKNNYNIKYETIKRTNSYHDTSIDNEICSATAIRDALKNKKDISRNIPYSIDYFDNIHLIDDYFNILKYKIITDNNLEKYVDVEEGIDNLLKKEINGARDFSLLINNIKSKRYTYNRISRMLIHILCGFTKEMALKYKDITYIRILGLNDIGSKYLNGIKKEIDVPLISKVTREKDKMLEYEIETTKIYDIINNNDLVKREFDKIINIGGTYDKK